MKILQVEELMELSLKDVKLAYQKLAQTYSRRLYERSKENKELAELIYGKRLTAKQMEKAYLVDAEAVEKNRYIQAYQNMVAAMGGVEGGTKSAVNSIVKMARTYVKNNKLSDSQAVRKFQSHVKEQQSHEEWYNWYYKMVDEYGEVRDKVEAGHDTSVSNFEEAEQEFINARVDDEEEMSEAEKQARSKIVF